MNVADFEREIVAALDRAKGAGRRLTRHRFFALAEDTPIASRAAEYRWAPCCPLGAWASEHLDEWDGLRVSFAVDWLTRQGLDPVDRCAFTVGWDGEVPDDDGQAASPYYLLGRRLRRRYPLR